MNIILSIISGILLALSFPKFSLWPLAWVALVPFFYALNRTETGKQALLCGLWFGLVFFGINLFWVTSLSRFAGWWAVTGWASLAIFQTLFVLILVLIFRVISYKLSVISYRPLIFSLLWIAVEWLRASGPFGVTGGGVGYSQAHFLPLVQIASFAQVYGVSFIVVFFNASLAEVAATFRSPFRNGGLKTAATSLFCAVLLIVLAIAYGTTTIRHSSFVIRNFPKLALIQPNVDQFDRMNPRLIVQVYGLHEGMTRQAAAAGKPEIIVWPETAVFTYLLHDAAFLPRVQKLAREVNAWLLIGTPDFDGRGGAFNSLVSLSPSGEIVSLYNKERLVPFGEYLPFRSILYPLLKGTGYFGSVFSPDPRPGMILAGRSRIAAAICFESTFPDLVRQRAGQGADFILTVTNDAWFADSAAPYQHFEAGIFRAVENRKYFVQVGNTGFSGVIDPYGRILRKSELNRRETVYF
ncbi:MAG: apolipoprotein N-acyltransferase [Candidatus Saganbacteria bacterium]|nr:apolipoprotein N-acyltransferase [Candidatus Saganbacteria bacterium]